MIKIISKAYQVGNVTYTDLAEAQAAELQELVPSVPDFGKLVLQNKPAILDILTTNAKSRPAARSQNGGTKTRKSKTTTVAPVETNTVPAPASVTTPVSTDTL